MQAKGLKIATRLLKKRVPSMKLTLDWRVLKARIEYVQFCDKTPRGPLGAGKLVVAYRNALVKFTQKARKYFSADAGKEIAKEIGDLSSCNDYVSFELLKAQGFLALLLPNREGIEVTQEQLDRWFHDWSRVSRSSDWDTNWFFIMDRVAKFSKSKLKWSHLIPQIFSRIMDTLRLPVGKAKNPPERSWDTSLQIFHPSANMPSVKMSRAAKLVIRLLNTPETMPSLIKFLRTWCSSAKRENFSHIPQISLYHSRVRENIFNRIPQILRVLLTIIIECYEHRYAQSTCRNAAADDYCDRESRCRNFWRQVSRSILCRQVRSHTREFGSYLELERCGE